MTFDFQKLKMEIAGLAEQTLLWNAPQARDQGVNFDVKSLAPLQFGAKQHVALLHYTEKLMLFRLAQYLAPGSRILELGTFLGGAASIMATANPKLDITTIDRFDDQLYHTQQRPLLDQVLGPGSSRSLERVQAWLKDHPQITVLGGSSPRDFLGQDLGLFDLIIEDADHTNPGLRANIDHWEPSLKRQGYYLFHDWRPWLPPSYDHRLRPKEPNRFPDVEQEVERLLTQGYEFVGNVRGFALLRKP